MGQEYFIIIFGIFGLLFGSFAGASVWRLRARQLKKDKINGEKLGSQEKKELKKLVSLTEKSIKTDRSECLECHHELAWHDLLPLISWVSTRGKCRYCKKSIGCFEPFIELATSVLFILTYLHFAPHLTRPVTVGLMILVLVAVVLLVMLASYDFKWYLLPDLLVFPLIGIAALYSVILTIFVSGLSSAAILQAALSVAILSGIYYLLYLYSKQRNGEEGTWIGFGDVKLNIGLGLLLGTWPLAFLALFLANVVGLLAVLPALITKRTGLKSQVPFGPMLIIGFFIAFFYGQPIINWYLQFNSVLSSLMATLML